MKSQVPSRLSELLMLRLAESRWSSHLEHHLRALAPSGILLAEPLPRSPDTLCELLSRISRTLPATPFMAIAEEGGAVDPLTALLPPLPSPRAVGAIGKHAARQAGELVGEAFKLLGFNTDLAPGLDLASHFTDKTLGRQTFGPDPRDVAQRGAAFVEGLERHAILTCGKHFPGLASVPSPTAGELSISGRSMAELWRQDLVPFRELLSELPLLMLSTAAYKAYDFDYPRSATLSTQVVEMLLRTKLGYRGVVVAPRLESEEVRGVLDLRCAAAQSVSAGCDLLIVDKEDSWLTMRQGLEQTLEAGKLPHERLDQALARIGAARKGLAHPSGRVSSTAWDRLARRFEEFGSSCREPKNA